MLLPFNKNEVEYEMSIAESCLMWPEMEEKMNAIRKDFPIDPETSFPYGSSSYSDATRETFANFVNRFLLVNLKTNENVQKGVQKEDIFIQNGASGILEMLGYALCEQNEYLVVPNPYYSGFKGYFTDRFPCRLLNSPQDFNEEKVEFSINLKELRERASQQAVKGILLCNPNNPCGNCYSKETLKGVIEICLDNNIHLISDEVYALSVADDSCKFTSAYQVVIDETESEKRAKMEKVVHVVYSLSKDFGICGFRIGILITKSEEMKEVFRRMTYHQFNSRDTVFLATEMLKDFDFVESFIVENKKRLAERFQKVVELVEKHKPTVSFVNPTTGLYLWIKFKFISTWQQETEFYDHLLNGKKIHLSKGGDYQSLSPGWYRIVVTSMDEEKVLEALRLIFETVRLLNEPFKQECTMSVTDKTNVDLSIKGIRLEKALRLLEFLKDENFESLAVVNK